MFWINGTNDFAYVMSSWQKSYRLPRSERLLSLQVRMKHSHPDGAKPAKIFAYAKWKLLGGPPLLAIGKQGTSANEVWVTWKRAARPVKAELCYTRDTGRWQDRTWLTIPVDIDFEKRRVRATIPEAAGVYYLNLVDERDLIVSTEHGIHDRIGDSTPGLTVNRSGSRADIVSSQAKNSRSISSTVSPAWLAKKVRLGTMKECSLVLRFPTEP